MHPSMNEGGILKSMQYSSPQIQTSNFCSNVYLHVLAYAPVMSSGQVDTTHTQLHGPTLVGLTTTGCCLTTADIRPAYHKQLQERHNKHFLLTNFKDIHQDNLTWGLIVKSFKSESQWQSQDFQRENHQEYKGYHLESLQGESKDSFEDSDLGGWVGWSQDASRATPCSWAQSCYLCPSVGLHSVCFSCLVNL